MPKPDRKVAAVPNTGNFALSYALMFTMHAVLTPYLQVLIRNLGYSQAQVGFFLSLYEMAGIAGPLLIARAADSRGAYRPALYGCSIIVILSLIPLVLFPSPLATVASLCFLSIGVKTFVPVMDASFMTSMERARSRGIKGADYGIVRGAGSAGFVIVALGLQSLPESWTSSSKTIAFLASLGVLSFVASLPALGEPGNPVAKDSPAPERRRGFDAQFLVGLAVIALGRLAMAPVGSFFSLYLKEELHWNAVGGMWALSAAAEIPMMLIAGRIIAKTGPMRAIAIASAGVAARLAIYALFPTPAGATAGQILHAVCFGLYHPAAVAFISIKFPARERAAGMAIFNGLGAGLPTVVGSALGGIIAQSAGYRTLFASFIPFALASVVLYVVFRKRLDHLH